MISIDLLAVARKVDNYDIDATAGGLWTDTTHYKVTCPAGKRWFVLGGVIYRNASGTVTIKVYNASAALIGMIDSFAAATGSMPWPSNSASVSVKQAQQFVAILDSGEYIEMFFGAAQDGTAFASCQVLEIDLL